MRTLPVVLSLLLPTLAFGASRPKVAVMEIRALGTEAEKAEVLSEIVLSEVAAIGRFEAIGKSDIGSMLGFERQKQMLGCGDASCMAEIGGALGVDYVLLGSLGKLGKLYRIDLKLIETQKSRVIGRVAESVDSGEEALVLSVQRLARQLMNEIPGAKAAAPPTPTPASAPGTAATSAATPSGAPPAKATATGPAATAAAPGAAAPTSDGSVTSSAAPSSSRRTIGWVLAGTGGAMLAGAGAFGYLAYASYQDMKKASPTGDVEAFDRAKSATKTRSLIADGLLGGGLVAAGIGTYLLLTGPSQAPVVTASIGSGGAGLVLSGRF